ncbi:MAG TPA: sulfurtransferase TusA family protein [Rhizomicrobium sp.]
MDTLDLRGLKCPLPALLAKRALVGAPPGASIKIVTDDPLAALDVPHMCHRENFEIVSLARDGDLARMVLRKP